MHTRRAGLKPEGQPSFDPQSSVCEISLSPAGAVIIMLAHPCLEAWLAELLGAGSGPTCGEVVDAIRRRIGDYDKKLLPRLILERARGANPPPRFVEGLRRAVSACSREAIGVKLYNFNHGSVTAAVV
jgi:hypothetical protein